MVKPAQPSTHTGIAVVLRVGGLDGCPVGKPHGSSLAFQPLESLPLLLSAAALRVVRQEPDAGSIFGFDVSRPIEGIRPDVDGTAPGFQARVVVDTNRLSADGEILRQVAAWPQINCRCSDKASASSQGAPIPLPSLWGCLEMWSVFQACGFTLFSGRPALPETLGWQIALHCYCIFLRMVENLTRLQPQHPLLLIDSYCRGYRQQQRQPGGSLRKKSLLSFNCCQRMAA